MIFEMITGDIATFGVIYVIVITAFGQGRKQKFEKIDKLNLYNLIFIFSFLFIISRYNGRWKL